MEKSVADVGYDVKKLPLGQLSDDTVKNGYEQLRAIEQTLKDLKSEKITDSEASQLFRTHTSLFYTYIPHNFGFANMSNFIINTEEKLKEKIDLINNLLDIKVAFNMRETRSLKRRAAALDNPPAVKGAKGKAKAADKVEKQENLIDQNYADLKCKITPLD
jgi:hypothetical protein